MGNDRNDGPGRWPDGVETYPADLSSYDRARQQLAQFQAPQLGSPPNGRVFVANFDGSWNDKDKDAVKTNVADIHEQLRDARAANVGFGYQSGVGTQDSEFIQKLDGALGYSYGPRMEKMYHDFCVKANKWIRENPNAEISLAATGFSRGATTAAMFTRMVHERGIQNPEGMQIDRDRDGNIQSLTPTKPNLVPPGKTPQVVGLFDPVATGAMNMVDTRLPPSVVSGFQITALDERRDAFLSKQIIDPGLSADGRFLAVQVAGAHSDIGGSYLLDGLSVRSGNLMSAYLNSTFDTPVLRERAVPTAPEMNVIHRSEQGGMGYPTGLYDMAGERRVTEQLAKQSYTPVGVVYDYFTKNMNDAEPVDRALHDGLRYRPVSVGPQREDPSLPDFFKDRPGQEVRQTARSAPLPGIGAPLGVNGVPTDPDHPDRELLGKLQGLTRGLDQRAGKGWDENSERMSASALAMAKQSGFTARDDLLLGLNKAAGRHEAGEFLFLARSGPGASPDPAANRAQMTTAEALSKPAQERYQEVEAISLKQAEAVQMAQQQEMTRGPDDPTRGGPTR